MVEICGRYDEGIITGLNDMENSPPRGEMRHAITIMDAQKAKYVERELQAAFGKHCTVFTMTGWGSIPPPYVITVIPKAADKGNAALYVQGVLALDTSQCICAGDTKGDAAMLQTGMRCVCVGNSSIELLEEVAVVAKPDLHYKAIGFSAAGVLEGLLHFRRLDLQKRTEDT